MAIIKEIATESVSEDEKLHQPVSEADSISHSAKGGVRLSEIINDLPNATVSPEPGGASEELIVIWRRSGKKMGFWKILLIGILTSVIGSLIFQLIAMLLRT